MSETTETDTLIVFKEGEEYQTTFAWGVGYVISESDAFDESLVDEDVSSEVVASIFQP